MASSWVKPIPPSVRHPKQRFQAIYRDPRGKQQSLGMFDTKREAKTALTATLAAMERGSWVDPRRAKVLFSDYAEQWYEGRRASVSESSLVKIRGHLDRYILPALGSSQLRQVTSTQVRTFVAGLTDRLAPSTIRGTVSVLKQIFDTAVFDDYLAVSPVKLRPGDLPRLAKTGQTVFLTVEQIDAIVDATPNPRWKTMITLAAWTGLRFGELAGLYWDHVDFDMNEILVRKALTSGERGRLIIGPPKTPESMRDVHLDPWLMTLMKKHRLTMQGNGLVFPNGQGRLLSHSLFRNKVWNPAVAKALPDGPRPTFHDLRHSHISHLLAAGMDAVVVAARVGHRDVAMTLNTYGHVRHDHRASLDDVMARLRGTA